MDRRREELVLGWLGAFTEAEIAGDPALSLFEAHRHLSAGDLAQAEHWAAAAAASLSVEARTQHRGHGDRAPWLQCPQNFRAPPSRTALQTSSDKNSDGARGRCGN